VKSAIGLFIALSVCALVSVNVRAAEEGPHGRLSEAGADTCLGCHNSESMLVIFRTAHGQQADPDSPMASLQCEACHGAGGDHSDRKNTGPVHPLIVRFGDASDTPVVEQNEACADCHTRDVGHTWLGSVHERNDTACVSCHRIHGQTDPVALQTAQADVCFDCHRAQRADSQKPSTHPIRFNAMVCTDCHDPHASVTDGLLVKNTTNELCVSCHAEYRGPVLFDHAPVSEDCTLCHEPHGSIHPALLTRRPPLLCQSCHSQRGHPSLSYTDQSLADANPSAMVLGRGCMNCHSQIHGSNHPSGFSLMR
jgi:DmsE family decaheme c-type cytochrome